MDAAEWYEVEMYYAVMWSLHFETSDPFIESFKNELPRSRHPFYLNLLYIYGRGGNNIESVFCGKKIEK